MNRLKVWLRGGKATWDGLSRRLGCGRWFLTPTQLPNPAGKTASLLLCLRFKPSKIIISPLTPPIALLLRATAHAWGLRKRGGAWGLAEGRAKGVLLVRELEE